MQVRVTLLDSLWYGRLVLGHQVKYTNTPIMTKPFNVGAYVTLKEGQFPLKWKGAVTLFLHPGLLAKIKACDWSQSENEHYYILEFSRNSQLSYYTAWHSCLTEV